MQIPQNFPQFEDKTLLIIVSWELQVKYYVVHNGEIDFLDGFFVVNPRAGLAEDYTKTSKLWISGNIYDRDRKVVQKRLLLKIKKETAEIFKWHNITDTYLFCIDFMMKQVKEALPEFVRKTLRFEYLGDMQYHTPLNLLEIVHSGK